MSSNLDVGPFGGRNTAVFQDIRASGLAGQSATASTDEVLDLNTEVVGVPFATLLNNNITLDEGRYIVYCYDALVSGAIKTLYWLKDASDVSYGGLHSISASSTIDGHNLNASFYITIPSGGKTLSWMHRVQGSTGTRAASSPSNGNEYYQQIAFKKIG